MLHMSHLYVFQGSKFPTISPANSDVSEGSDWKTTYSGG